jgi:diacylglycerol kinase family enzyme
MQVEVLLNDGAGTADAGGDAVHSAFAAAGVEARVRVVTGEELVAAARQAAQRGVDAVVAGGGDGTVSAVAGALAGGATPLGVLPLGTLNHFAKDVGLPLDLPEAARVIAAGRVVAMDVARVNDRVFINNSSVGVYARALVDRDARRERVGLSKWPAMFLAMWKIFRLSPMVRVTIATPEGAVVRKTPLVFIGNNCYSLDLFRVGSRECLSDGILSLYVANTSSRWGMLKLGVRAALGRLAQARDFEMTSVEAVEINSRRSTMHVAIDGEVMRMTTPLRYSISPGALNVLAPNTKDTVRSPHF